MGTARYVKKPKVILDPLIGTDIWPLQGIRGSTGGPGDRYPQPEGVKGLGWLTDMKYPDTPEKLAYQDKAYDYHTSWEVNKRAAMAKWLKEQLIKPHPDAPMLNPLANLFQLLGGASGDAKRNLPSSGQSKGLLEVFSALNNAENLIAGRGDWGDVGEIVSSYGAGKLWSKAFKIAKKVLPYGIGAAGVGGLVNKDVRETEKTIGNLGVILGKQGLNAVVPKIKDIYKGVELRNK